MFIRDCAINARLERIEQTITDTINVRYRLQGMSGRMIGACQSDIEYRRLENNPDYIRINTAIDGLTRRLDILHSRHFLLMFGESD